MGAINRPFRTSWNERHHADNAGGDTGCKRARSARAGWRAPAAQGVPGSGARQGAFPAAEARPTPPGPAMPEGGGAPGEAGGGEGRSGKERGAAGNSQLPG